MQNVKDNFEENEQKIREMVKLQELTLSYGESINWSKVNRMIDESINWNKVIELVQLLIPRENITKIKAHTNANQIKQYKDLVTFLFSKLNYSQKSQVSYLKYWETSSSISTSHTTSGNSISSSNTNTSNNNSLNTSSSNDGDFGVILIFIFIIITAIVLLLIAIANSK